MITRAYRLIVTLLVVLSMGAISQTAHASTYRFCADWAYNFEDWGLGEDYLLPNHWLYGAIRARYTRASLFRSGQQLWHGTLDDEGCVPPVPGLPGQYQLVVFPALEKDGAKFLITADDNHDVQTFQWTVILPGTIFPSTQRAFPFTPFHPITSAASVVVQALNREDHGLPPGQYRIYAMDEELVGAGYHPASNIILLGKNSHGQLLAFNKSTVGHELGHAAMNTSMGYPFIEDTQTSDEDMCRCNHVTTSNSKHCFQSQHATAFAQSEGWGHFYAGDIYNNPTHNDAYFAYYKEVLFFEWLVWPPPVVVNIHEPINIMDAWCPDFDHGVEGDWMGFYWHSHNKGEQEVRYSYPDFADVYKYACTGSVEDKCFTLNEDHNVLWSKLVGAVIDRESPEKALHWTQTGGDYGVNF